MGRGDHRNVEGSPTVRAQRDVLVLDDVSALDEWSGTGAAANLVASPLHILGQGGLAFDKIGGSTDAGITRTLPAWDGSARFSASDLVELVMTLPASMNGLSEVELRIGTSPTNYAVWRFASGEVHLGDWDRLTAELAAQIPSLQVGVGMDLRNIRFVEVIVRTNSAGQTFIGGVFDSVALRGSS